MRRFASVIIALATSAAVFGLTAPAHAGPVAERYVAAYNGHALTDWFWVDQIEGIIGCAKCGWLIDHQATVVLDPDQELAFQSGVMGGLYDLSQAKVATDPRTQAAWRARAQSEFTGAAKALGKATARVGVVGYYDPDKGAKIALYRSWLSATDQDIADGLTLFQRAIMDPEPAPWFQAGMAQFDQAYAEISAKRAIG
jgi:hypothetical protein